jgi:hypothetical protein
MALGAISTPIRAAIDEIRAVRAGRLGGLNPLPSLEESPLQVLEVDTLVSGSG